MNERQKYILLIGFGVLFAMLVFTPWSVTLDPANRIYSGSSEVSCPIAREDTTVCYWRWWPPKATRLLSLPVTTANGSACKSCSGEARS